MKFNSILKSVIVLFCIIVISTTQCFAKILNVSQKYQEKDQWCWAASSQAVLEYYEKIITQHEIAQYGTDGRNVWNWLTGISENPTRNGMDFILNHFGDISTTHIGSSLSQKDVQREIDNKRPILINWQLDNGGGHQLIIQGIESDTIYLMDPWNGPTINDYSWVLNGGGHRWAGSLRLDNNSPKMEADINHDEKINLTDVITGLQIVTNSINGQVYYNDADINGDDKLSIIESVYLLQKIAGLRDKENFWSNATLSKELIDNLNQFYRKGDYVREAAFTANLGWVNLINFNEFSYNDIPQSAIDRLGEFNGAGKRIKQIAFTPDLGWVMALNFNGFWYNNIPESAIDKLWDLINNNEEIKQISFNGNSGWTILSGFNGFWYNNVPQNIIDKLWEIHNAGKEIKQVAFTPNTGWVILSGFNDFWYNNIPEDLIGKLFELKNNNRGIRHVSFLTSSDWLILGGM